MNPAITTVVLAVCLFNLIRMAAYLLSSDTYSRKLMREGRSKKRAHLPSVSVVIPAHNEETTIVRALGSVHGSNYPSGKLEIIIANDGSTDRTAEIVREYKRTHKGGPKIRLINRPNKGKAAVLNYVFRRSARGSIMVCLDADSYVDPMAIRNGVQHFRDRNVVALSSNVNIIEDGFILALVQKIEYLVGYHMKRGQALLGVEYIIGGIGSMFRKSMLQTVSFYDTNTMTEDIDLTLKIINKKRKNQRIAYAADSIVYTEPAHSVTELTMQRYRWKYGRSQTFLKHSHLFFSKDTQYRRRVTWFMLPYALLQDIIFFFEPFIIGYFIYYMFTYADLSTFAAAFMVLSVYLLVNVWSSDHLKIRERARLSYYIAPMYLIMFVLSFVEYIALLHTLIGLPKLGNSIRSKHITWKSPARSGLAVKTASS